MSKKCMMLSLLMLGCTLGLNAQAVKLPTKKASKTEKTEKKEKADKKTEDKAEKKAEAKAEQKAEAKTGGLKQGSMTLPTVKKEAATPQPAATSQEPATQQVAPVPQADGSLGVLPVTVRHREVPRAKPIVKKPKVEDNQIYESAEHMPTYPGGVKELQAFISERLQYPETALADSVEDIIQVAFIVEKDGTPKEFEVIDEHHPALEAEAVRVLEQMPKWKPATHNGVKVRVEYVVPVKFKLPNL